MTHHAVQPPLQRIMTMAPPMTHHTVQPPLQRLMTTAPCRNIALLQCGVPHRCSAAPPALGWRRQARGQAQVPRGAEVPGGQGGVGGVGRGGDLQGKRHVAQLFLEALPGGGREIGGWGEEGERGLLMWCSLCVGESGGKVADRWGAALGEGGRTGGGGEGEGWLIDGVLLEGGNLGYNFTCRFVLEHHVHMPGS